KTVQIHTAADEKSKSPDSRRKSRMSASQRKNAQRPSVSRRVKNQTLYSRRISKIRFSFPGSFIVLPSPFYKTISFSSYCLNMTGKPKSGKSLLQTGHIYLNRIFIDILRGSPKRGAQSLLCHSLIRMSHQLTKDGPLILCQKDGPSLQEK